jgi:hypothetical protein
MVFQQQMLCITFLTTEAPFGRFTGKAQRRYRDAQRIVPRPLNKSNATQLISYLNSLCDCSVSSLCLCGEGTFAYILYHQKTL